MNDWITINIDGAWDIILLGLSIVALLTSGSYVVEYVRSILSKRTENNKLDTLEVVQKQIEILQNQLLSLNNEITRLTSSNEETRLHKIELMKSNIIMRETITKLKKENENYSNLLKDLTEQNTLLKAQNELLNKQIEELKDSRTALKKEIELLKNK